MNDTTEYNDIMAEAAIDAVKYVQKEYDYALDYSEQSINDIEKSLVHIHRVLVTENDEPIDPQVVVTLSNWYGAYVGEVFRRCRGGDWGIDNREPESPVFEVQYRGLGMAFSSRVFHRIMGGEENNLSDYYNELIMKLDAMPNNVESDSVMSA